MQQRIKKLSHLRKLILASQPEIISALAADSGKPAFESLSTEVLMVTEHIKYVCRHLKNWMKPETVRTSLLNFPAKCEIRHEPLGKVLIFSAWNYPFQLALLPLIGAYAAGNCVVLKPSELAPETASLLEKIIGQIFSPDEITIRQGGAETATALLTEKFDLIFFTGSERVGKIVAEAAAKQMTPAVLELGGKSPCIVDNDADLSVAARRIAWGKWLNAGQTCVAPDYVLIHEDVKEKFVRELQQNFDYFSRTAEADYARIINRKQYDRLIRLAENYPLKKDDAALKIFPAILHDAAPDSPVMQEEIFGPLLPVIAVDSMKDAVEFIRQRPCPLALYYFGYQHKEEILTQTKSGSAAVNDCIMQITNEMLPFGGTGASGMGSYHGKQSFLTFTHAKSVMEKTRLPEIPFRYPPCSGWKMKLLRWFLR